MFRLLRGIYEQNRDLQKTGRFFYDWAEANYMRPQRWRSGESWTRDLEQRIFFTCFARCAIDRR